MNLPRVLLLGLAFTSVAHAVTVEQAMQRMEDDFAADKPLVAHVVVALCDNEFQGIVPVPATLGNGADPGSNLYWGAMYGIRSYFNRSAQWKRMPIAKSSDARILERAMFRREITRGGKSGEAFLVAEAWNGRHIADAIQHFLELDRGQHAERLPVGEKFVGAGGAAHVTAFVGHNGLMDFPAPALPRSPVAARPHASVVLACLSDRYFAPLLRPHSVPLLTTTGLMAPEAYTLEAVLDSWFSGDPPAQAERAAARAYARYQKIPERSALRLFLAPEVAATP